MIMFESENHLKRLIQQKKDLLRKVINDQISTDSFYKEYDWFYNAYALDGHESDDEERNLLLEYDSEIEIFRIVEEEIFNRICSDDDSKREIYIQQGRISAKGAVDELKNRRKELGI